MPYDPHGHEDEEEDRELQAAALGKDRRFADFDCPSCAANNPYDDGIGEGDEVLCYYCGQAFKASVTDDGRLRLKEA